MVKCGLLLGLAALLLAPAARAGGPAMIVGAAEDGVKQSTIVTTKAKLDLLRLAGFNAVRVTAIWAPGQTTLTDGEAKLLANTVAAAELTGMRLFVAVTQFGSRTTPLTEEEQAQFAEFGASIVRTHPSVRDMIVGNEPNLNRFWMPQFGPNGENVAAPAYMRLLARTYDTLKTVDAKIRVIGGAVSPRGGDRPGTGRDTHSPTAFIRDLGKAYRESGRTLPIMDEFAINPYMDNSSMPPTATHPTTTTISIADHGKLVGLLGEAFDGTAQRGSSIPIVYAEFGVEAQIPTEKASLYGGREPATVKPVDEATQGEYYRQAIGIAFCQPTVRAFLVFHAFDEADLDRWQSGVFYADGTAKTSLPAVKTAARASRGGVVARCDGMALTPSAKVAYPSAADGALAIRLTCDIDCNVYARLEKLPRGSTTLGVSGRALAGVPTAIRFPDRRVQPGRYRFTVRLTAPVNVGAPRVLVSPPLSLK